jgi:hypothetical protein
MYILMRWWCQLYHCENNVHSDEMMMSAISLWEQCTFWWDGDVSYIIVRTMYILQNVHCSHNDIADIIISSKCTLFSQWYSWQIAHLVYNNNHSLWYQQFILCCLEKEIDEKIFNGFFDEMMMSAISLWEQCTFWWDDDVSYIIVSTMYILMRWWCQLYHCENNVHSDEMMLTMI